MSIKERMAEILSHHAQLDDSLCCECGEYDKPWGAHVASVLVAELGLQPRWSWESAEECRPDGFGSPEEALAEGHDRPTHCRYVTPWELS